MAVQHMAVQLGTWILVAYLAVPARSSADPHAEVAEMGGRTGGQDAEQCSAITNPLPGVVEQSELEERGVIVRLCGFEVCRRGVSARGATRLVLATLPGHGHALQVGLVSQRCTVVKGCRARLEGLR